MSQNTSHKERTHSIMGGSRATIFMNCTGYFAAIKGLPAQEPSKYADTGTLFHEMMEIVVHDFLQHKMEGTDPEIRYHLLSENRGVDEEMRGHIELCKNLLWEKGLDKYVTGKAFDLETYFSLGKCGDIDIGGPADFWAGYRDKKGLRAGLIVDWKYGFGYVDEKETEQLIHYATSMYQEFKRAGKEFDYIRAAIVQPRAGGETWREVKFTKKELERRTVKVLQIAHDVFVEGKIKYKAGKHCEYCPAKGDCDAHSSYLQKNASLLLADRKKELPDPKVLTPEQIANILKYKDEITDFLKECYSLALRRWKEGQKLPGWKVVNGTAKRKWLDEHQEIGLALVKQGLTETPFRKVKPELRTITEIEKELKKLHGAEEAKSILANYTEVGALPEILVPESDARSPVKTYKDLLETGN